jgi:hypothetical protein
MAQLHFFLRKGWRGSIFARGRGHQGRVRQGGRRLGRDASFDWVLRRNGSGMQVMGKERMRAGFGLGLRGSGKFEGECEWVLYACLWFHPMFFSWAIGLFLEHFS